MLSKEQIDEVKAVFQKKESENVSFAFHALADPGRFRIFQLLVTRKDMCVTDIANVFDISVPAASQQLKVLEMAGFVSKERMGQMICYELKRENSLVKSFIDLIIKNK